MILISFSIALIAIVFGAMLLAQTKKDSLGNLFKFISWFVIVMGLLVLLCDGMHAIMRCCNMRHERMMDRECMMMDRGGYNDCMMGGGNCMMGNENYRVIIRDNKGNNMCCEGHGDGMMNCNDGKCNEGDMKSGSCPMMDKMKGKTDSTKEKK